MQTVPRQGSNARKVGKKEDGQQKWIGWVTVAMSISLEDLKERVKDRSWEKFLCSVTVNKTSIKQWIQIASNSLSCFATNVLLSKCLPYNFDSKAKVLANTSLLFSQEKHSSVVNCFTLPNDKESSGVYC